MHYNAQLRRVSMRFKCSYQLNKTKQMPTKKGLDKKMNIGKFKELTPKQIIDSGNIKYIDYLDKNRMCFFTAEVWRYIEEKIK